MAGKNNKSQATKLQNKTRVRIARYEKERQQIISRISSMRKNIKQNGDVLSEREIQKEKLRIFNLTNYREFLERKIARNSNRW
jgi:TolA-binding protein